MSKGIRSTTVAEQLLSVEAAADRLDTTPRFIRRLIAERRIEYHKVGRHVRISEFALAEFIEAAKVPPLTEATLRPKLKGVA
jgi:excisionase family DNA binding protein